jgi:hypothetical protein
MTKKEAIEMLAKAPRSDRPSRVNPALTERQAVELIEGWFANWDDNDDAELTATQEKRVWQVYKNRRVVRI